MAGSVQPDTLNIVTHTEAVDLDLSMFWAGYLFNSDDHGKLAPELATKVPTLENGGISKDGLTITYHLRKGVLWHDGARFGADDVIFTWHALMNPRNIVASRLGYELIRSIDKRDDWTIAVHLRRRYAPFVDTFLTMANFTYCVLPKHLLERYADLNHVAYSRLPVGTGPFRIVENDNNQSFKFVRNEHYWRGPAKLKEIDYQVVPSDNTLLTLLRAHEIDFYSNASAEQAPVLAGIAGMRIYRTPFKTFLALQFNMAHPALRDLRVRQALAYGVNRPELVSKVTHGVGILADNDQSPVSWAYNATDKQPPYDPARAASLLDQAGWHREAAQVRVRDGKPLELVLTSVAGSATDASAEQIIAQRWSSLGIRTLIRNYPANVLFAPLANGGIEQNGKFDVTLSGFSDGPDPDDSTLFTCAAAPPAGENISHYCNPQVDRLAANALVEYDQSKRKALYQKEQALIARDLPALFLWFVQRQDVVNGDLQGYRPGHIDTPFWNTWQWSI